MIAAQLALLLVLAAPADAPPEAPAAGGALGALAEQVTTGLGAPEEGRRGLALALQAPAEGLAPPLSAALVGALGRAGWSVSPVAAGATAEPAARAAGADWLLRLSAGPSADGRDVVAVGEAVPLWSSFFLQARPGVRPAPPRLVTARAPADAATRLLLGQARRPELGRAVLRRLIRLPYRVLALAAGDAGEPAPSILVVTPDSVRLLDGSGRELASRALDPRGRTPTRLPAASAVLAPLGGGPMGLAMAGAAGGEVLVRRGTRLELVAQLPMAPLAAGDAGILFGAFAEGRGALQDLLALGVDRAARPRSGRDLVVAAAAPRGGPVAFAALRPDGTLELMGPELAGAGAVAGVGAGFALADLDGDGRAELVASLPVVGGPDRLRVLRLPPSEPGTPPAGASAPAFESGPMAGAFTAGAAADLTGDGRDDALLAAEVLDEEGAPATELWLVTLDPLVGP